jgi:hypothetical protein
MSVLVATLSDDEVIKEVSKLFDVPESVINERASISYLWNLDEFYYLGTAIIPLGKPFCIKDSIDHLVKLDICSSVEDLKVKALAWLADCFRISLQDYYDSPFHPTDRVFNSLLNSGFFVCGLDLDLFVNKVCWQLVRFNGIYVRIPYGSLCYYGNFPEGLDESEVVC